MSVLVDTNNFFTTDIEIKEFTPLTNVSVDDYIFIANVVYSGHQ